MLARPRHAPLALRPLASACLAWVASTAAAAQADESDRSADLRVEVTGSHIPRAPGAAPLPLQIITAEEIRRAGWTTTAELMANVPASFNGRNDQLAVNGGDVAGSASANLRGLGDGNTLVLLNGRRLSNYAYLSGSVDLGGIPLAALERVEILKDGASSIYGSDAVAGVVNFITRRDYAGVEIAANVGIPQHGGAEHYQVTGTAGGGDLAQDGFNAFVTVDWQRDESLRAIERPFSRTGFLPEQGIFALVLTAFPANIVARGRFANPRLESGCAPPASIPYRGPYFVLGDIAACLYDVAAFGDSVPASERLSVVSRATWQYGPEHALFAEYVYAQRELDIRTAPTPVNRRIGGSGLIARYPRNGPYYPADFAASLGLGGNLDLIYRTVELGPRVLEIDTRSSRLLVGGEGRVGGFDYSAAYNVSRNSASETFVSGYVYGSKLVDALGTGLVNPWGASGPDGLALLRSSLATGRVRTATGTLQQLDLRIAGETARLAAGPLTAAFGVEGRREDLDDRPSDIYDSGDVVGFPASVDPQQSRREVMALFAEANVPLASTLEAQVSVRLDHYSDFGSTTNPKVALRWQPAKALVLRGAWGTGFRAPTLPDLGTPVRAVVGVNPSLRDPLRCPVTQAPEDCGLGTLTFLSGGNVDLAPERSTQWTAGVIVEPFARASLTLDYWSIRKRNVIAALFPEFVYEHFDVYGASNIVRGNVDPAYPALPGPIERVIGWNQNVGNNATSGVDLGLRASSAATAAGRFMLVLDGTFIIDWTEHLNGVAERSVEGRYLFGPVPRWRHYLQVAWAQREWESTLGQRYQSGYVDAEPAASGDTRRVGSYSLVDLQVSFKGMRSTVVDLGVRNLFDRAPPFTNAANNSQIGYDPTYADPRGRTFYARVSHAFR
jgi:iron complex outermembrane receptor protein